VRIGSGEEEKCPVSALCGGKRPAVSVVEGNQGGLELEAAPGTASEKPFFLFIIPKCGSECIGLKRKAKLSENVSVRVGY